MHPPDDTKEFERMVVAYTLNELSLPDLERWAYERSSEILSAVGPNTGLALLEANFSCEKSVTDALNPWFRKRFPNVSTTSTYDPFAART